MIPERCRAIIARLANPEEAMLGATARLPLGALLDDIAAPYRGEDLNIIVMASDARMVEPGLPEPQVWRAPELLHGLGNIIENAADFASSEVMIAASWNAETLSVEIEDDGPGFAPEIYERIGEPYVTSRPGAEGSRTGHIGMGLGFFISKTLLERSGALVTFQNGRPHGAVVSARWPRSRIEVGEA